MSDSPQPESAKNSNTQGENSTSPQPAEAEAVRNPDETAQETQQSDPNRLPTAPTRQGSWLNRHAVTIYIFFVLMVSVSLGWVGQRFSKSVLAFVSAQRDKLAAQNPNRPRPRPADPVLQAQAEDLVKRLASGDPTAADLILSQSQNWTGKILRTSNTDRFVTAAINLPDMHAREAAVEAELALSGITRDENGLHSLEQVVGDPRRRPGALWSIGALGNRGVDPVHTAKIIESYLNDPDPYVRSEAVDGLALLATSETIPMLLERFRNDPSTVVQEHAACDMSQSGMYSHAQRMQAGATLMRWLDDPLLTGQQRTWIVQALNDITGASLGPDPVAWHKWWSQHSPR